MKNRYKFYNNSEEMEKLHEKIKMCLSADEMAYFITCKVLGTNIDTILQKVIYELLEEV